MEDIDMEQNLNYYRIFYEVAKAGNISKAAKNLYISQPAVSKSITKLEDNLSHALFLRSKRGVKLTEEGEILYEHLDKAFSSIETAEKMLNRIDEFGLGQIRIGVSTSLCKHILLPYLQDFISENPHIKVSIACNPTFETLHMLKEDKIDIGLICNTELEKDYQYMPLRSIQDTFVATKTYINNLNLREQEHLPDNRSFQQEKSVPQKDTLPPVAGLLFFNEVPVSSHREQTLTGEEIIEKSNLMLLDKGNISRQYIDAYMKDAHIEPGQILEVNNMDLLIDFASIGMGVACVVREFVTSYIESGQVVEIPLDREISKRSVGFVYNSRTLNTTTKRFLDFCR